MLTQAPNEGRPHGRLVLFYHGSSQDTCAAAQIAVTEHCRQASPASNDHILSTFKRVAGQCRRTWMLSMPWSQAGRRINGIRHLFPRLYSAASASAQYVTASSRCSSK